MVTAVESTALAGGKSNRAARCTCITGIKQYADGPRLYRVKGEQISLLQDHINTTTEQSTKQLVIQHQDSIRTYYLQDISILPPITNLHFLPAAPAPLYPSFLTTPFKNPIKKSFFSCGDCAPLSAAPAAETLAKPVKLCCLRFCSSTAGVPRVKGEIGVPGLVVGVPCRLFVKRSSNRFCCWFCAGLLIAVLSGGCCLEEMGRCSGSILGAGGGAVAGAAVGLEGFKRSSSRSFG